MPRLSTGASFLCELALSVCVYNKDVPICSCSRREREVLSLAEVVEEYIFQPSSSYSDMHIL